MFNGYSWKQDKNGKIHERLAYYIAKKNERLEVIAKKTGLSAGTITNYCTGKHDPKAANLKAICDYLGISVISLIGKKGSKNVKEK